MRTGVARAFVLAAGLAGATGAGAQSVDLVFRSSFDEIPEGPATAAEASRFLGQATFGATRGEITRLQGMGYNAWLDEQILRPPTLHRPYVVQADIDNGAYDPNQGDRTEAFGYRALTANDQLRQRVAYALSQIFVVSDRNDTLANYPYALANWNDFLLQNAFGNYRSLLEAIAKHPVMGVYLSHLGNQKPDPANNIRPDENFAREILQLFSIGLVQLNPDGTPVDGDPVAPGVQAVPTYDQQTIRGFAHVFTGWNYHRCDPDEFEWCGPGDDGLDLERPMVAFPAYHATDDAKQLLVYPGVSLANGVLPAGGSAQSDLSAALDNIAAHPNVGPFLSRLLIQRLVSSNPSAAYVQRVAAVFDDDNGATAGGVRGNLGAVVRAILLDPEARNLANGPAHAGKLREPQLRLLALLRAFEARGPSTTRYDDWRLRYPSYFLGQSVLSSPTVFNFYLPAYRPRGELAASGLFAPEFQILTDGYLTEYANTTFNSVFWLFVGNDQADPEWLKLDLTPWFALANDAPRLVDELNVLLMGGRMSAAMRQIMIDHVQGIVDPGNPEGQRHERVTDAIWLITMSPEGVIER